MLDGLDECDKKHRKILLDELDILISQCKKPLKVYIASRPTQDLECRFDNKRDFKVDTSHNKDDIETYVHQAIRDFEDWDDEEVSSETRELVAEALISDRPDSHPM